MPTACGDTIVYNITVGKCSTKTTVTIKKCITSDYDLYTKNLDLDYTCRNWILVLLYPSCTGLNQPDNIINIYDHKFVNSGTRRNNHMHAVARLCTRTTAAQHTTGW